MKTQGFQQAKRDESIYYKVVVWLVRTALRFDKRILKRWFHIETPLYKIWYEKHAREMDVLLCKSMENRILREESKK